VFFYFRFENFFQNYRLYASSKSDTQLSGTNYGSVSTCTPRIALNNDTLNTSSIFLPCGLLPATIFNDSFRLLNAHGKTVNWTKQGIAWSSDFEKFSNPPNGTEGIRVIQDFQDEDFINWMRISAFPDFRKLHRIVREDLKAGNYIMEINNTFPVDDYAGQKYFVLTTPSWYGGKSLFLGIAFLVVGGFSFFCAIIFLFKQIFFPRRVVNGYAPIAEIPAS